MVVDLKALVTTMTEEERRKLFEWITADWETRQLQSYVIDDLLSAYKNDAEGFERFLESSLPDDEDDITDVFKFLEIQ